MKNKRILTIQDISCVGQCSLTVALPVISACGIETAILPSSVLSNHTSKGFNGFTFCDLTPQMSEILEQWTKNNLTFDAFYTGYLSAEQIPIINQIIEKTANPGALKIVDPVMADNGQLYSGFSSDFPKLMLKLCKNADYLLPNITEASLLLGTDYPGNDYSQDYIKKLCLNLAEKTKAKNIIITGVSFEPEKLGAAIYNTAANTIEYYFTKRLPKSMHGTGDLFASSFTGALLRGKSPLQAVKIAANFVVTAMENTPSDHWYGVCFEQALPKLIMELKE